MYHNAIWNVVDRSPVGGRPILRSEQMYAMLDSRPKVVSVSTTFDLFDTSISENWLDTIFALTYLAPQHVYLVHTRDAQRMRGYFNNSTTKYRVTARLVELCTHDREKISVERADVVIAPMRKTSAESVEALPVPAPFHFLGVSVEVPEQINKLTELQLVTTPRALTAYLHTHCESAFNFQQWVEMPSSARRVLHWVIAETESGRQDTTLGYVIDQCVETGTPIFVARFRGSGDVRKWPEKLRAFRMLPPVGATAIELLRHELKVESGYAQTEHRGITVSAGDSVGHATREAIDRIKLQSESIDSTRGRSFGRSAEGRVMYYTDEPIEGHLEDNVAADVPTPPDPSATMTRSVPGYVEESTLKDAGLDGAMLEDVGPADDLDTSEKPSSS